MAGLPRSNWLFLRIGWFLLQAHSCLSTRFYCYLLFVGLVIMSDLWCARFCSGWTMFITGWRLRTYPTVQRDSGAACHSMTGLPIAQIHWLSHRIVRELWLVSKVGAAPHRAWTQTLPWTTFGAWKKSSDFKSKKRFGEIKIGFSSFMKFFEMPQSSP